MTGWTAQLDQRFRRHAIRHSVRAGVAVASAFVVIGLLSGCAALRPLDGMPARYVPESLKGPSRSGRKTINLSLLSQTQPPDYLIDSGDVLGIYIDKVLGQPDALPPVHFSENKQVPPTMGYPIPVRSDGTISLPLLSGPVRVSGLTVRQIEEMLRRRYTSEEQLLNPTSARILVSLQRPREYRVMVIRQEVSQGGIDGNVQFNLGQLKHGSGQVVSLPAYENDVLHALSATNGLPGLDAKNTIYIIRRRGCRPGASLSGKAAPGQPARANAPSGRQVSGLYRQPGSVAGQPSSMIQQVGGYQNTTAAGQLGGIVQAGYSPTEAPPIRRTADRSIRIPGQNASMPAAQPTSNHFVVQPPVQSVNRPVPAPVPHGQLRHQAFDVVSPVQGRSVQNPILPTQAVNSFPTVSRSQPVPQAQPVATPPVLAAPGGSAAQSPTVASLPGQIATSVPLDAQGSWPQFDNHSQMLLSQGYGWNNGTVEGSMVTRIPVRLAPGETPRFSEQDIILNDGDIVFIESRETEVFYTGGLLGGGQFTLPRDYDLDVLGAVSIAQGRAGGGGGGDTSVAGISALNQDVSVSASKVVVLRTLPNGTQMTIKVDLYEALRNPAERIAIQPGDYVILQFTPTEAVGAWLERYVLRSAFFGLAASQINNGN